MYTVLRFLMEPKRSLPLVFLVTLVCAIQSFYTGFIPLCFTAFGGVNTTVTATPNPASGFLLLGIAAGLAVGIHKLYK